MTRVRRSTPDRQNWRAQLAEQSRLIMHGLNDAYRIAATGGLKRTCRC
jgi:hypothetical protein